jgi:hypothetical protein
VAGNRIAFSEQSFSKKVIIPLREWARANLSIFSLGGHALARPLPQY